MTAGGSARRPPLHRRRGRLRQTLTSPGLGAVSGQFSQALTSLALQVMAARLLGAEGLGLFALIYAMLVLATAASTGMVGDSLTVLERGDRRIRGGLQSWALVMVVLGTVVGAVVGWRTGAFGPLGWLLCGAGFAAFLLEDSLRRLLMASTRFWSLLLVDGTALIVGVATVLVSEVTVGATLAHFVLALLLGQAVAAVVAVLCLPRDERVLAPLRGADLGGVARFGSWRAAQQMIRPALLAASKMMVAVTLGAAALGQVEGARVYAAPALLVVQGLGGYFLTTFARRKQEPLLDLRRRADVVAVALMGVAVLSGAVAVWLLPVLGPILTGGSFVLNPAAVWGWVLYAGAAALIAPYSSLAAVRGRQPVVVALRVADAVAAVALLAVLLASGAGAQVMPYVLAFASLLGAVLLRSAALDPGRTASQQSPPGRPSAPTHSSSEVESSLPTSYAPTPTAAAVPASRQPEGTASR